MKTSGFQFFQMTNKKEYKFMNKDKYYITGRNYRY